MLNPKAIERLVAKHHKHGTTQAFISVNSYKEVLVYGTIINKYYGQDSHVTEEYCNRVKNKYGQLALIMSKSYAGYCLETKSYCIEQGYLELKPKFIRKQVKD